MTRPHVDQTGGGGPDSGPSLAAARPIAAPPAPVDVASATAGDAELVRWNRRELDRLRVQNQELRTELVKRRRQVQRLRKKTESLRFLLRSLPRIAWKGLGRYVANFFAPSGSGGGGSRTPRYDENFNTTFTPYRAKVLHPHRPNRPRVLHVIGNFRTGGSARLVVDIFEHLEHRFRQDVLAARLPEPAHYEGMPVAEQQRFTDWKDAYARIERYEPEIIHVHYVANPDLAYGWYGWEWYSRTARARRHPATPRPRRGDARPRRWRPRSSTPTCARPEGSTRPSSERLLDARVDRLGRRMRRLAGLPRAEAD